MLMIIMILSFISGVILTDGYLAFGYVFMAFAIVFREWSFFTYGLCYGSVYFCY